MSESRHLAFALAVAIVLVVAASGASPVNASTPKAVAPSHPQREVFGFALASSLGDPTVGYPSWNFDLLSTVAFFGLHVDGASGAFTGDSGWSTWNSSTLANLVSTAHQHGTKVVLTVILQDFSPNTPSMCAGLRHADATVAQTVSEVKAKGVDGVNIDYEGLDGSCGQSDSYWAQHAFTTFVAKMRAGLGASAYLSVDTYASSAVDGYGFFDVRGIASYADSLFVMAYDQEYSNYSRLPVSCARFCLGPTSPLTAYYYNDTEVVAQYASAVGAAKVLLGVPYYGRKACVGGAVPNAYPLSGVVADTYLDASSEAGDPAVAAGSYAVHRDAYSAGSERWDTWYNKSLGCTRELYWDDAVSLGKKYDLVNASSLRGVGLWNLNYGGGAPELWAALAGHFANCAAVSVTAVPATPVAAGSQVTATAQATGCSNPVYEFWLRPASSSIWQRVQAYSTSPTYKWNTSGAHPGTVFLGVHARDTNSSSGFETYGSVAITVFSPCTSVSLTGSPASPTASGTAVTLTASAPCPNPLYEFWLRPASSSTWQMVQAYSAAATFRWNSSGAVPGTVYLGVHVRDANSTSAYDAVTSIPNTVFSPCTSAGLTSSPATTVPSGAAVTLSAKAAGCLNPVYEFWIRPAGSTTWQQLRAYGSSSTYTWNSAGAASGAVYLGVHVRDAGSPADYDANTSIPTTVFTPCSAAGVTITPATPIRAGTQVTVMAHAAGCANPVYEFWIRPAGSNQWQLVRAYGPGATYVWNSAGANAGTVYVGVHARDAQSPAAYDSVGSTPLTVN